MALALLLSAALAVAGCTETTPEAHGTATVTFSIAMDEVVAESLASPLPGYRSAFSVSRLGFSPTDVTTLRIDVKETDSGAPIYLEFDLTLGAGGWTGTLPFLPKGKTLTFSARAYDVSNTLLFGGSTDQSLISDAESVVITLAPSNDGATITLPRIKKIVVPYEFALSQSGNISFSIEGNASETLRYTILPAQGGGAFYPSEGSITLQQGIAGTFVSRYVPPVTVAAITTFTHQVQVTNEAGHSVSTTFRTRVLPPDSGGDATGTRVSVLFNPVINHLSASRIPGSTDVVWEASVADDAPLGALSYAWSFTPEGSVTPEPAFASQANPTTLHNYSAALQGTLTLEVTDTDGGKTTVLYALTPDQFPDDASEMGLINTLVTGDAHTCALLNDGNVRCWGLNNYGQLGYGHTNNIGDNELPYTAGNLQLGDGVVQLAAGAAHTCALLRSGYVRCWGRNNHGQLGYGHVQSVGDDEPLLSQSYVNLGARAVRLAAGYWYTCALLTTGKVRCWGLNDYGQLGYGHTQNVGDDEGLWDVSDVQVGGSVQELVAGGWHTCALLTGGRVRCWGANGHGQLGYGHTTTIGDNEHPSSAGDVNVGGTVLQLSASYAQTCALLDTGSIRCWGYNNYGQLGYGNIINRSSPGGDLALGARALQVTSGGYHTCALLSSGQVKCWGYNGHGELGYGHTTQYTAPISVSLNLGGATAYALTAGGYHTCALLSSGQALCWGANGHGQLGYGHTRSIGDDELPFTAGEVGLLTP